MTPPPATFTVHQMPAEAGFDLHQRQEPPYTTKPREAVTAFVRRFARVCEGKNPNNVEDGLDSCFR